MQRRNSGNSTYPEFVLVLHLLTDPIFMALAPATLIPVTAIIASFWYKAHRDSLEASLKHDMLQRGMSADDIVSVLQARGGKFRDARPPSRAADERVQAGGWRN